jgi:hypothetical protein
VQSKVFIIQPHHTIRVAARQVTDVPIVIIPADPVEQGSSEALRSGKQCDGRLRSLVDMAAGNSIARGGSGLTDVAILWNPTTQPRTFRREPERARPALTTFSVKSQIRQT